MAGEEGRFSFSQIYDYLKYGIYPNDFDKEDKRALRKRADYFTLKGAKLRYLGGKLGS